MRTKRPAHLLLFVVQLTLIVGIFLVLSWTFCSARNNYIQAHGPTEGWQQCTGPVGPGSTLDRLFQNWFGG